MKSLFVYLVFIAFVTPLTAQSSVQYREYKMPLVNIFTDALNKGWANSGKKIKIISEEVIQRVSSSGRTSSIRGHFVLRCEESSDVQVDVITSTVPDGVPTETREKLNRAGLSPVTSIDHAMAYLNSANLDLQKKSLAFVGTYIGGACIASTRDDFKERGYNISVSLWLSADEKLRELTLSRISRSRFEELK